MAAPAYVSAGAGERAGSGGPIDLPYPASISAGDLLIIHGICEQVNTLLTPSGWTLLHGPDDLTSLQRHYVFAMSAAGGETGTMELMDGGTGSTQDLAARMYKFSPWKNTTPMSANFEDPDVTSGSDSSIEAPSVTTAGADRLAVCFVHVADDNAVASFTGETGGDWTEAVAEYTNATGDDFCLQLQTATMASAGTISGGSQTMGAADPWGARAFAIIGTTADTAYAPPPTRHLTKMRHLIGR